VKFQGNTPYPSELLGFGSVVLTFPTTVLSITRSDMRDRSAHRCARSAPNRGSGADAMQCDIHRTMKRRTPFIAVFLVAIYFLLSFNAYACLVPLYGGAAVEKTSDCAMPQNPPVQDPCASFKSIGVQTHTTFQPFISDVFSHHPLDDIIQTFTSIRLHRFAAISESPHPLEVLTLTSVLRI